MGTEMVCVSNKFDSLPWAEEEDREHAKESEYESKCNSHARMEELEIMASDIIP